MTSCYIIRITFLTKIKHSVFNESFPLFMKNANSEFILFPQFTLWGVFAFPVSIIIMKNLIGKNVNFLTCVVSI